LIPPDFLFFQKLLKTPECTPPEVLFNQVCTFKAPLYSLGAITYALFNRGTFHVRSEGVKSVTIQLKNNEARPVVTKELESQMPELKLIFLGLLQVSPKDRMSFVETRDFVNRMFSEHKQNEDAIRSGLLNKVKAVSEYVQTAVIGTQQNGANDGELKRYPSLFRSPVPGPGAILKSFKKKGWNQKSIEQTINFAKNCKKSDIDDEYEMKNFPFPLPFSSGTPRRSEKMSMTGTMSLFSKTRMDFSSTKDRHFRISDYRKPMTKRSHLGETARDPWMGSKSRFFDHHS
jgi:hypothetical protein